MMETISRGAANQSGARTDTDAYAKAADFLTLKGIDHVEFWVGDARQTAACYRALWGFTPAEDRPQPRVEHLLELQVADRGQAIVRARQAGLGGERRTG